MRQFFKGDKIYVALGSLAALSILTLSGMCCMQHSSSEPQVIDQSSKSNAPNPPKAFHQCREKSDKCYEETFQQPPVATKAVDILFVVETSLSVADERQTIANAIPDFLNSLPSGADYNVAVMLSHGGTSAYSGVLYKVDGDPLVLKSKELTPAQIASALSLKLNQVIVDTDNGGGEEGIFSLFHGITTPGLLAASQAAGFFRPEAALGVVFLADRRDICAIVPAGVTPESDPVKLTARIRDCEGLTVAGLTNRLKLLKGAQPIIVSGILYADSPVPNPTVNELGYGYLDMIALNGGEAIDIVNDNIANGLSSIALLTGQQMTTQNTFTLGHPGANSASIKVSVNGQSVPFQFDGDDTVTLTQSVPLGATVVISYCVKSTEDDEPSPHHDRHHHSCKHRSQWAHWKAFRCKDRHDKGGPNSSGHHRHH